MYIPYCTHWSVGKRKKPLQIWSRISCLLNQKSSKSRKCHLSKNQPYPFIVAFPQINSNKNGRHSHHGQIETGLYTLSSKRRQQREEATQCSHSHGPLQMNASPLHRRAFRLDVLSAMNSHLRAPVPMNSVGFSHKFSRHWMALERLNNFVTENCPSSDLQPPAHTRNTGKCKRPLEGRSYFVPRLCASRRRCGKPWTSVPVSKRPVSFPTAFTVFGQKTKAKGPSINTPSKPHKNFGKRLGDHEGLSNSVRIVQGKTGHRHGRAQHCSGSFMIGNP